MECQRFLTLVSELAIHSMKWLLDQFVEPRELSRETEMARTLSEPLQTLEKIC